MDTSYKKGPNSTIACGIRAVNYGPYYTDDKTITISTGYITFLLGLITVILHNIWAGDLRVAVTILGWVTPIKGVEKIGFPEWVNRKARMFKGKQVLWGSVIFLIGARFFCMSLSL